METIKVFIPASTNDSYASLMYKAIQDLENTVYFPAIKTIKPEYQEGQGLILTVTYDPKK